MAANVIAFLARRFSFAPLRHDLEICILAGGLSTRMGRDKARLRVGGRTLLAQVRAHAAELSVPVRVLRKDIVPRCGPLGGIYSALKASKCAAILFLPCDTPFLTTAVLRRVLARFHGDRAVFATAQKRPGFPVILPRSVISIVERQIKNHRFALHELAVAVDARRVRVPAAAVFNINTPEELAQAKNRQRSAQEQLVKK